MVLTVVAESVEMRSECLDHDRNVGGGGRSFRLPKHTQGQEKNSPVSAEA
jgi:hypothetical protein